MSNGQEIVVEFRDGKQASFAADDFLESGTQGSTPVIELRLRGAGPGEMTAIIPLDMVRAVYRVGRCTPLP